MTLRNGQLVVQVKCYSNYTYTQKPQSFIWQELENKIERVERAWQEPDKKLFKVVADDGNSFELCYNEITDQWSLREERSNPRKRKNK